jgi:Flagellar hook-length control protein FliK
MTGLDSAIAALLASRTELLLSAIGPSSGATSGATTAQTGTSQFIVDTPRTTAPSPTGLTYGPPVPSAQTEISDVARTLDAISRFGGGATPAVIGDIPLWPNPPRVVLAASAFGTLSDSLFSSTATTANATVNAAAPGTVNPPAPLLATDVLASTLAKTVGDSGLFYESHVAQWFAGQRSLASLDNEPQANVDNLTAGLPFGSSQPSAQAPVEVWIDETLLPPTFSADTPDPQSPIRLVPAPQTPQQAAALAASVRAVQANVFSSTRQAGPMGSGAMTTAAYAHDSAVQAATAAGIHPSTIPLVRQQLDVLATDQFRWSGEAWPGAKFEWEIQPRNPGFHERDAVHDGSAQPASGDERAWHTRVTLALPVLGNVDADLVLTGQHLVVRLNASANGALLLAGDGQHFQQQLEAAGLQLAGLTVRAMDALAESTADPASAHFAAESGGSASTSITPGSAT